MCSMGTTNGPCTTPYMLPATPSQHPCPLSHIPSQVFQFFPIKAGPCHTISPYLAEAIWWIALMSPLHSSVSSPQLLPVWLGTESNLFRQHWRTDQALAASEQAMTQFFLHFSQFNSLLSYNSSQKVWKCNFCVILPNTPDDITGRDTLVSNVSLQSETRLMR